jgi:hypothetical protein
MPSDVSTLGFSVVVVPDPSQTVAKSLQAEAVSDECGAQSLVTFDSGDRDKFTSSLRLFMTR